MTVPTQIRIDAEIKKQASELFASLGLDMSTAVNLFLRQCLLKRGIPFPINSSPIVFADELTKEELDREILKGIDDVRNGRVIPAEEAFKAFDEKIKKK